MNSYTSTTVQEIKEIFSRVIRKTVFGGKDLVLMEPFTGQIPHETYATVRLMTSKPAAHEIKEYQEGADLFRVRQKGTSWCTAKIQVFGGDAFTLATSIQNAFLAPVRLFDLLPKIGLGEIGVVQDASESNQEDIKERAFFEVSFYANISSMQNTSYITNVNGAISSSERIVPFHVSV